MHQIPMLTSAVPYVRKDLFVGAVQKLGRSSDISVAPKRGSVFILPSP